MNLALWIVTRIPVLQSGNLPLQSPGDHDGPEDGSVGPAFAHGPDSPVLQEKRIIGTAIAKEWLGRMRHALRCG